MRGIRATQANPPKQIGLVRAGVHALVVKHFADLDAATEQLGAHGLDVGNDQVQALRGAGGSRGDVLAENDRAAGARRRELDHAEVVLVSVVGVEPPSELRVELLRAIDVGDGEDDDLKLHVNRSGLRVAACVFRRDWLGAHGCLRFA